MKEDQLRAEVRQTLQKFVQAQYRSSLFLKAHLDRIIPTALATMADQNLVTEIIQSEVNLAHNRLAFLSASLETPAPRWALCGGLSIDQCR